MYDKMIGLRIFIFVLIPLGFAVSLGFGQTKKTARPTATPVPAASTSPTPEPAPSSSKKNERPTTRKDSLQSVDPDYKPTYFYEFSRPGFLTSHVVLEHDVNGKGKISYLRQDFTEMLTDPIQLTPVTMKGINDTLERMNYLGSTENYQFEKDFSNMGDTVFRFVKDGRERTVKYNWTENKDAKFLMDEYRRISDEAVWIAELAVSRVNQPLESARRMDELDSYLSRGEITDPPHLIPLLKELAVDERLPLIARNHATKLIARIEKAKK